MVLDQNLVRQLGISLSFCKASGCLFQFMSLLLLSSSRDSLGLVIKYGMNRDVPIVACFLRML